jgi:hypothetical protein
MKKFLVAVLFPVLFAAQMVQSSDIHARRKFLEKRENKRKWLEHFSKNLTADVNPSVVEWCDMQNIKQKRLMGVEDWFRLENMVYATPISSKLHMAAKYGFRNMVDEVLSEAKRRAHEGYQGCCEERDQSGRTAFDCAVHTYNTGPDRIKPVLRDVLCAITAHTGDFRPLMKADMTKAIWRFVKEGSFPKWIDWFYWPTLQTAAAFTACCMITWASFWCMDYCKKSQEQQTEQENSEDNGGTSEAENNAEDDKQLKGFTNGNEQ